MAMSSEKEVKKSRLRGKGLQLSPDGSTIFSSSRSVSDEGIGNLSRKFEPKVWIGFSLLY